MLTVILPLLLDEKSVYRLDGTKQDLILISSAIDDYYLTKGSYPKSLDELNGSNIPIVDKWGKEYIFLPKEGNKPPVIGTYGADGIKGGKDENKDVFSNKLRE